jgi:hypothetical protein
MTPVGFRMIGYPFEEQRRLLLLPMLKRRSKRGSMRQRLLRGMGIVPPGIAPEQGFQILAGGQ